MSIEGNGVVHAPPAPIHFPAWLAGSPAAAPTRLAPPVSNVAETIAVDASLFAVEPVETTPDNWDWWDHISDADAAYLLGPRPEWRPELCPWCFRRGPHTPECVELHQSWRMPMPWGKHRGEFVDSLDEGYLAWLAGRDLGADLAAEVTRVVEIRRVVTINQPSRN